MKPSTHYISLYYYIMLKKKLFIHQISLNIYISQKYNTYFNKTTIFNINDNKLSSILESWFLTDHDTENWSNDARNHLLKYMKTENRYFKLQ